MRLYRKGFAKNGQSSWFPTILEAISYPTEKTENEEIMGIMWVGANNFSQYFESSGIGYKPKSEIDLAKSGAVIQYLTIEKLRELLENPIATRFYHDGQF